MAGGASASKEPGPWGPLTGRLPGTEQRGLGVHQMVASISNSVSVGAEVSPWHRH